MPKAPCKNALTTPQGFDKNDAERAEVIENLEKRI
jgi:hypothetical protein